MAKITIKDECVAPSRELTIHYTGKDPSKIANSVPEYFLPFFNISSSGWNEELFNWDASGEKIEFFIRWWVKVERSNYSNMWFWFTAQGDEDKATKEGRFKLEIYSYVEHKFEANWLSRGLWWLYHYLFYNKRRQEFIKRCKELTLGYKELMKKEFDLQTTPSRAYEKYPSGGI